jgi:hypothetical protein
LAPKAVLIPQRQLPERRLLDARHLRRAEPGGEKRCADGDHPQASIGTAPSAVRPRDQWVRGPTLRSSPSSRTEYTADMATVVVCTHCGLRYETTLSAQIVSLIGRCEWCRRRTLSVVRDTKDHDGQEDHDDPSQADLRRLPRTR